MTLDAVLEVLEKAEVPSGRIYSIADIAADLHYQARGMIERHKLGERRGWLPGIVPKLSAHAGRPRAGSGPGWASTPTRSWAPRVSPRRKSRRCAPAE